MRIPEKGRSINIYWQCVSNPVITSYALGVPKHIESKTHGRGDKETEFAEIDPLGHCTVPGDGRSDHVYRMWYDRPLDEEAEPFVRVHEDVVN